MAKIADVQEVSAKMLRSYERNAKKHGAEQVEKLKKSIQEFGFLTPCLIDSEYNLIAGHGRVMAAKELGLETVPCVFIEGLTEDQRKAYILADNRLGELGEWDMDIVNSELESLKADDFDISTIGFDIDIDLDGLDEADSDKYTSAINIPQYEPSGEETSIYELYDDTLYNELIDEINKSNISEAEKDFLKKAASRHIVFSYKKIADYYAGASQEMQKLMEHSALVIIDVADAIKYGYARLASYLDEVEAKNENA